MKNIFLILLITLPCLAIFGQQGNPFDVGVISSSHVQEVDSAASTIDIAPTKQSSNPFDLSSSHEVGDQTKGGGTMPVKKEDIVSPSFSGPSNVLTLVYSILMLVILTFAISLDRARVLMIFNSLFNSNHLKNLFKDSRAWTESQSIVLYVLFFANGAFLSWLINSHFLDGNLPSVYVMFLVIFLTYMIRHVVMWLFSYIYGASSVVDIHNYSIGIHNIILGVLFIPFILILGFLPIGQGGVALMGLVAIIAIVYFLRQIKGCINIISMREFNVFYFFIYLCAIEIAPFLIMWKVINGAL